MDRALEHVKQLDDWYDEWIETDPYTVEREYHPKGGAKRLNLRLINPVPIKAGIILGDVVHNMRCALDHLAGAVAVKNGKTTKGVYFPIVPDRHSLASAIKDKLGKCPQSFRDFVECHKPYKGGNNALYALHQIDIMDKHRVVVPIGVSADVRISADKGFYGVFDFSKIREPIKIPRPKGRAFIEDGETVIEFGAAFYLPDKTKIETSISPEVVFGDDTPCAGRELKGALREMFVTIEAIITVAEPLFLRD